MTSAIRALGSSIISGLRMASPFLLDQLIYQIFAHSRELKARNAYKAASLAGCLAIWKICPAAHQKLLGGLYAAYKIVHYLYLQSSASSRSDRAHRPSGSSSAKTDRRGDIASTPPATPQLPDPKERAKRFFDFRNQFIIRCSNGVPENLFARKNGGGFLLQEDYVYQLPDMQSGINIKKGLWKEPQTQQQFEELFQLFVQDMEIVYQRLEEEGVYVFQQTNPGKDPSEEEKYQAMAQFLETSHGDNDYDLIRWCDGRNMSLPKIYEMVRNRLVLITLERKSDNRTDKRTVMNKIVNEIPDPFVTPGTREYQWKETYNGVIQKFAPILKFLQPSDPILKYMTLDNLEETY